LNWQLIDFKEVRKDRVMTDNNLTTTADRTQQVTELIEVVELPLSWDAFETQKERMIDEVKNGRDISFAVEGYYEARAKFDAFKTVLNQIKDEGLDKTIRRISYDLQNGCYLPINDGVRRIEENWRFRAYSHVLNILERFKDRHSN